MKFTKLFVFGIFFCLLGIPLVRSAQAQNTSLTLRPSITTLIPNPTTVPRQIPINNPPVLKTMTFPNPSTSYEANRVRVEENSTCGNAKVEPGEDCDSGGSPNSFCNSDCTLSKESRDHIIRQCTQSAALTTTTDCLNALRSCIETYIQECPSQSFEICDMNGSLPYLDSLVAVQTACR